LHELPLLGSVRQEPEDKAEQLAIRHKIIALVSNRTLEIPAYRAALTVCANQGSIVMRAVYDLFLDISSGNEATGNARKVFSKFTEVFEEKSNPHLNMLLVAIVVARAMSMSECNQGQTRQGRRSHAGTVSATKPGDTHTRLRMSRAIPEGYYRAQ